MAQLVHCPACDRHVLATERACPFCEAAMPKLAQEKPSAAGRGLTRAAILFAGATAVTGCSDGTVVPLYGPGPVDDASSDARKDGEPVALYGPAPVDAGPVDANDAGPGEAGILYGPGPVDSGNG